jgi:hypothetical protein
MVFGDCQSSTECFANSIIVCVCFVLSSLVCLTVCLSMGQKKLVERKRILVYRAGSVCGGLVWGLGRW